MEILYSVINVTKYHALKVYMIFSKVYYFYDV